MSGAGGSGKTARSTLRKLQHDLRTPISQIIGYSEMVKEDLEERDLHDLIPDLEHVRSAAHTLLALVDGVFRATDQNSTERAAATATGNSSDARVPVSRAVEGARLLLVDDEPSNRELLGRQLERAGYVVTDAASGAAALAMIENERFDLVLLDVMMPEMTGLETLAAIRLVHSMSELPVVMATALAGADDVVAALAAGANDHVTKPFDMAVVSARVRTQLDLRAAAAEVEHLAEQLEIRNAFLRQTFGRYISDDVVASLLQNDEGLEIRGERRTVSILMADLRGFTSLTESLGPEDIVSILNSYLSTMAEIIQDHQGSVDEFLGDAILAHFGAITTRDDDAERCVACAIAMQQAIAKVNRISAGRGLPSVEMGIGIATGEVVVGNLGSEVRSKHTAIGSAVNLAARIEGQSLGGEVLVSQATHDALTHLLEIVEVREIWPKGFDRPQQIHRVASMGDGTPERVVPVHDPGLVDLAEPLPVMFSVLEGKTVAAEVHHGQIVALSSTNARLLTDVELERLVELRLWSTEDETVDDGVDRSDASFAKVVDLGVAAPKGVTLRFTLRSEQFAGGLGQG